MDRTEAARLLGSLPKSKRYARVCPICATAFTATARGIYCNPLCAVRAQTKRKTAARQARWLVETPAST